MKIVDMHSHWGTRRGFPLRTPEELAQQKKTWNSEPVYHSEAEMVQHFRDNDARVVLDLGYTKYIPIEEVAPLHDYSFDVQRKGMDVIAGHWLHVDPLNRDAGVRELRRCIEAAPGFVGYAVSGSGSAPASDPIWFPFYDLCAQTGTPVLIFVGTTGLGAGLPGGGGILLDNCHPRHLDFVAAKFPSLRIVAARPGWPWQTETIAVLMHKRNIWYELHGWSPKYFTTDLKHEISRRLRNRVMFGADYPLYSYNRLRADWEKEGYAQEVLESVFYLNAERFLAGEETQ